MINHKIIKETNHKNKKTPAKKDNIKEDIKIIKETTDLIKNIHLKTEEVIIDTKIILEIIIKDQTNQINQKTKNLEIMTDIMCG